MKKLRLKPVQFKKIRLTRCAIAKEHSVNLTRKSCKSLSRQWHIVKRDAITYAAKLNVPLLPKNGEQQIVLGTSKYLLPYIMLPTYFNTFYINPEVWTLEANLSLIECIAKKFIKFNVIRFVTTPKDLLYDDNHYRITAEEICVFKKYDYHFYKYISKEFDNIYFCSKVPLTDCELVNTEEGEFKCKSGSMGKYLYF